MPNLLLTMGKNDVEAPQSVAGNWQRTTTKKTELFSWSQSLNRLCQEVLLLSLLVSWYTIDPDATISGLISVLTQDKKLGTIIRPPWTVRIHNLFRQQLCSESATTCPVLWCYITLLLRKPSTTCIQGFHGSFNHFIVISIVNSQKCWESGS